MKPKNKVKRWSQRIFIYIITSIIILSIKHFLTFAFFFFTQGQAKNVHPRAKNIHPIKFFKNFNKIINKKIKKENLFKKKILKKFCFDGRFVGERIER
jgi:hypothetical protein